MRISNTASSVKSFRAYHLTATSSVSYSVLLGNTGELGEVEVPEQAKTKKHTPKERESNSRKVCLYLGSIATEVDAASEKLGVSRSRLLVRAWELAKTRIAAIPGVPPALI
jgi:hypothetical protein